MASSGAADMKVLTVSQGEFKVSRDSNVTLTTVLGSCVAVCVRDLRSGIGGMNHFLLPRDATERKPNSDSSLIYGMYSIERLINAVIDKSANKRNLEVKVFGGARMLGENLNVGEVNSQFVEDYFHKEGMTVAASDLRGEKARKVSFVPATGQVFVAKLTKVPAHHLIEREKFAISKLGSNIPYGNLELLS
jgi:chemotaxis protein CheD